MGSPIPREKRLAHDSVVAIRRERVAMLTFRLMRKREIFEALADPDGGLLTLNPHTGQPYSESTIYSDIKYVTKKAQKRASEHADKHLAMLLEECREARRVAWSRVSWDKGALANIHKFIDLEAKLLGLYQPDVTFTQNNQQNNFMLGADGQPLTVEELSDDDLRKIAGELPDVIEGGLVDESTG